MGAALVVALIVVPLAEIWTIVQVSHVIGGWPTLALLLVESLLGAWLVRREGRRAWHAFRDALAQHRAPAREVSDAALVLLGGALLLTPGFLTDIVGGPAPDRPNASDRPPGTDPRRGPAVDGRDHRERRWVRTGHDPATWCR